MRATLAHKGVLFLARVASDSEVGRSVQVEHRPLANSASGEAKKTTAAATSSFVTRRRWALGAARIASVATECRGGHVGLRDSRRYRRDGDPARTKGARE
jgi:hypothetical protein